MMLRTPLVEELPALSALCLRSKGYWGYDQAFLDACREELTVTPEQLEQDQLVVCEDEGTLSGVVHVIMDGRSAELEKLFIDPAHMGRGAGRQLFDWACQTARSRGAEKLWIIADPDAVPFYEKMGAKQVGAEPSGSIKGRSLPKLLFAL